MGRKRRMARNNGKNQPAVEEYGLVEVEDHHFDRVRKSKAITLSSGDGEVTLAIEFNPFTLSPKDREFMMLLVDTLTNYENSRPDVLVHDFPHRISEDDVPF
jgi:hypothetical protein